MATFTNQIMDNNLPSHPLRVFLCHGSEDKPTVREIYSKLLADGIQPWLDEMDLLPGQDWNDEIIKAVRTCDAILVCLSSKSVRKEGYIQKEIMFALDVANEKPEDTIFVIPIKLDPCELPRRLSKWQYVEYSAEGSYAKILRALKVRAGELGHENHSDKAVLAPPLEDSRRKRALIYLTQLKGIPKNKGFSKVILKHFSEVKEFNLLLG